MLAYYIKNHFNAELHIRDILYKNALKALFESFSISN